MTWEQTKMPIARAMPTKLLKLIIECVIKFDKSIYIYIYIFKYIYIYIYTHQRCCGVTVSALIGKRFSSKTVRCSTILRASIYYQLCCTEVSASAHLLNIDWSCLYWLLEARVWLRLSVCGIFFVSARRWRSVIQPLCYRAAWRQDLPVLDAPTDKNVLFLFTIILDW